MKKIIFGLLLCATPVWAGNLCYSSSAAEDAALADAATRNNATQQQMINATMADFIRVQYRNSVLNALGTSLVDQWPTFTNTKKTNICTALSVSPCPP